jgi:hypothetical protein
MQKDLRNQFNDFFSEEKYEAYKKEIEALSPGNLDFTLAETPVFISKEFTNKMLATCEHVVDAIVNPSFNLHTQRAIPNNANIANEKNYPDFLVFDFGICENEQQQIEPQLIEMQGFPSLFAFQPLHSSITFNYANVPNNYSAYLNGYTQETYFQLLKEIVVGDLDPSNVILLDLFPAQQKTRIDFYCSESMLGIKTICLTQLIGEGNKLFYELDGKKIAIDRIYNRLIFDELFQQKELPETIDLFHPWEVEWQPHPNWFYRVSKFTLPLLKHPYIPSTYYLNELKEIPADLDNYVLKPLFSFAGMGVIIEVTVDDIMNIKDPENWILQRKVNYASIIMTPDEPAKAEIRLFYFWKKGWSRPQAVFNLARLSKGKMIGTRYNKNKKWVGGTVAYFEK